MKTIPAHTGSVVFLLAVIAALAVPVAPGVCMAELYQWTDKDGVLHITDDMGKVPEEIRWRVEKFETTPAEEVDKEADRPLEELPEESRTELYGGETLEWWVNTIRKKNQEIQGAEQVLTARKQYISVYERGRSSGGVFAEEELEKYREYKDGLAGDEAALAALKDELAELKRKATRAGVPRKVREQ